MPSYKILGIYSFANNIKNVKVNDEVIIKNEKYNIKSKNAIGVYSKDNKKLGYFPIEKQNEVELFKNSYKISNIVFNKEFSVLEISRLFQEKNSIDCYFPYEKQLKYEYKKIDGYENKILALEKYLLTKKIKIKKIIVIYADDNFINILIETANKKIEQFQTITFKYFQDNYSTFEEFEENQLIDNLFYRDFMFYRLECYIDKNYVNIMDYHYFDNYTVYNLKQEKIHEDLEINNDKIDILLVINMYMKYLINNDDFYLLKFINNNLKTNYQDVKTAMSKLITNYELIKNDYNLTLGKLTYDHKLKIYEYIDFVNEDSVFVIGKIYETYYLHNLYLTNKKNLIVYLPLEGKTIRLNI